MRNDVIVVASVSCVDGISPGSKGSRPKFGAHRALNRGFASCDTRRVSRRIAEGFVAVCLGVALQLATMPSLQAMGLEPDHQIMETAATHGSGHQPPRPGAPRIALYGDSLISEAGQDFESLAKLSSASVQVHAFPGTSPCNYFTSMAAAAKDWHPTVAMLAFTGDAFTACMDGVQVGTSAYFTKYKDDTQTAISIFRSIGAKVILVGLPADASAILTRNASALNQIYRSLAKAHPGVTYDDAGQAVMAKGRFTWTLHCLSGEPCTGPDKTNIVRAPDGVHFCPNGKTSPGSGFEQCDVYSSGAFRFASAMLKAALGSVPASGP